MIILNVKETVFFRQKCFYYTCTLFRPKSSKFLCFLKGYHIIGQDRNLKKTYLCTVSMSHRTTADSGALIR